MINSLPATPNQKTGFDASCLTFAGAGREAYQATAECACVFVDPCVLMFCPAYGSACARVSLRAFKSRGDRGRLGSERAPRPRNV